MAKVTGITKEGYVKTSDTLRLLAKRIDEGEEPEFFLVIDNGNATISSAFNDGEGSFFLLGAIEAEKMVMMYGD